MKKITPVFIALLFVSCSTTDPIENTSISEENTIERHMGEEMSTKQTERTVEVAKNKETDKESKEINEDVITEDNSVEKAKDEVPVENFHDYNQWNTFLVQHVSSSGKVNYAKIKTDTKQLSEIILSFEKNVPSSTWSSKEQLSYWINAYNLYTLKFVSDHYPISSITKITAKPWDKKFISLGGETLSLNDIEHKKIRAKNNEPRIHFALNCASESCPMLYNVAFTPKNLSSQLTKQTKRFLADNSKNDFSDSTNIKISSLFDWYKDDFIKKEGSVVSFINKYRTEQLVEPKISYLEYFWGLND